MSDYPPDKFATGQDFLAEAEEISDSLAMNLDKLSDRTGGMELDPDLLNAIFRDAHSIKGLAGVFGYGGITVLAHEMESLLDLLRLGRITLDKRGMELLFDTHVVLKMLLRDVSETGSPRHDDELASCASNIHDYLQLADMPDSSRIDPEQYGISRELLAPLTDYERHRLVSNIERGKKIFVIRVCFGLASFDGELTGFSDILKVYGEIISTLPSANSGSDDTIGFDILFGSNVDPRAIQDVMNTGNIQIELLTCQSPGVSGSETIPEKVSMPNQPVAADAGKYPADPDKMPPDEVSSVRSMSRTVRVDIARLDELMHSVAELTQSLASINGMADALRHQGQTRMALELNRTARLLERRIHLLREHVVAIRLIPISVLYERLSLAVRSISREQNKNISLRMNGGETELDKLIMEDIADPLMHIIRNAIDHGIESPEMRRILGKDDTGIITLTSRQQGGHVVIEVEDDGQGIDLDLVRNVVRQRGYTGRIDAISDRELIEFIFQPGFSTRSEVSGLSGRGVGMDVVRNNINVLSGNIDVESNPNRGTLVRITIPITLAIIKTVLISRSNRTYALPVATVLESLLVDRKDFFRIDQMEAVRMRDSILPLLRLEDVFEFQPNHEAADDCYVVVVGIADVRVGLVVDDLMGQRDVIIQPLGDAFKGIPGISGAADLGELGAILVLDVAGMLNEPFKGRLRQYV